MTLIDSEAEPRFYFPSRGKILTHSTTGHTTVYRHVKHAYAEANEISERRKIETEKE
jgi:hypothetical protein